MLILGHSQYNPGCIFPLQWRYSFIHSFIHPFLNQQIFTEYITWQRSSAVVSEMY
jgi:hypothetical protein